MNLKLLTMLNPKNNRWDGMGGKPSFTVEDLCFVMGGADTVGLEILRRKYSGVKTKEDFSSFYDEVVVFAEDWRIDSRRSEKLKALFELVIFEATALPVCSKCKGRGENTYQGKSVECSPCRGTGSYRIRAAEKARHLGIAKQNWKVWEARYRDVKMMLDNHVHEAVRSMNKRMEEE